MKSDSFKKRYFIKIASSVVTAALNMIIQLILLRAFSVEEFGYYSYNLNVFTSVVVLMNLSASNALVSKLAKRNDDRGLIYFYLKFYALVSVALCVVISVLFPTSFIQNTFAGQTFAVVLLGLLVSIVSKLITDTMSIYDAFAVSRFPAVMYIVWKIVMCAFVITTYFLGRLNISVFYVAQIIVISVVVAILLIAIIKEQRDQYPVGQIKTDREYLIEYADFCKTLVASAVFAQVITILMNWALMRWSGTTEQALFGAAWQLNTLVGYVFSPYAELSKREFAVLYNDKEQLANRYIQSLKMIFWMTAFFAVFIGINADWFLAVVYGDKYTGAYMVTLLIMFYTVFQAWGQVGGALMIGMEYTKINAILSVTGQVLTVALLFLFQIPNFIWPESLGSVGIALNYFCGQILMAYVTVVILSKKLEIRGLSQLAIPIVPLLLCSACSLVLRMLLNQMIVSDTVLTYLIKIGISGIIYSVCIGIVIWLRPSLAGLSREAIKSMIRSMIRRIKN